MSEIGNYKELSVYISSASKQTENELCKTLYHCVVIDYLNNSFALLLSVNIAVCVVDRFSTFLALSVATS